jgi:hypothetical protein
MKAAVMALPLPGRVRASVPAAMTVGMQGLNSLSNLLITWFLIRSIGVVGFGYYSTYFIVAVNGAAVAGAFIVSPLNSVASKLSERRQAEFIEAATFGQYLVTLGALAVTAVGMAGAYLAGFDSGHVLAVGALTTAMNGGEFWRRIRFFRKEVTAVLAFDLTRYVLLALALAGLPKVMPGPGALAFALAIAATYPTTILLFTVLGATGGPIPVSLGRNRAHLRRMIRTGRWLASVAFLKFMDGGAVLFISFVVLGPYQAGLIRLAQTIVGLTTPAMQSLEHIVPRNIGQHVRAVGFGPALRSYHRLAAVIAGGFALLYVGIVAASPLVLRIMHVPHDGMTIWLVAGFSVVYLFTTVLQLIEYDLRARERAKIVSTALLASAIIGTVIAYPCAMLFGALGSIGGIIGTRTISILICLRPLMGRRKVVS